MNIVIGSDHAAYNEKQKLMDYLKDNGHEVMDVGPDSDARCNYPDFAISVAKEVVKNHRVGILLCGSGIGVSMVANRFAKVRAALCRTAHEAQLSRAHNNSNILCLGARINSFEQIIEISCAWLAAEFEKGRHTDRVALFNDLGQEV
jgi:ribose 5-phosphate isomerase B